MNTKDSGTEPTDAPAFMALDFSGQYVDAGVDLDQLLADLESAVDDRSGREELIVWQSNAEGERVVAVVQGCGQIVRLDREVPEVLLLSPSTARRAKMARRKSQNRVRAAQDYANRQEAQDAPEHVPSNGEAH